MRHNGNWGHIRGDDRLMGVLLRDDQFKSLHAISKSAR